MPTVPVASVLPLDPSSEDPPFEQVRVQIAGRVARGDLVPGTKLPTVRALADQLGLAVNTVARAYKELEADRVVVTEGRRGTFVAGTTRAAGSPEVSGAAATYAGAARRLGLTLPEALRAVERAWPVGGAG